jgi:hypothetical protein
MSNPAIQAAQRFAHLLDQQRYDELADVLDSECSYEFRDRSIQGAQKIIETYRANTEWGFGLFDRIEFDSEVVPESDQSARVRFSDRLFLGNADHRHICEQIVTVDDTGRIIRIEHCDLEGETEALDAFLKKCDVSRPADDSNS